MDNIKDDKYFVSKILEDLSFIMAHTQNKTQKDMEQDEVLIDSIMFRLIQIAENDDKLTDSFKLEHNNIPWRAIKGMRNTIVHDYGAVNLSIVYDTIIHDVPDYYEVLKKLI